MKREKFSSQLGFLLTTAGCAIGLGNVYRFPYITGQYGGAFFVLIYLLCLLAMGLPLVVMELSVGRGSRRSAARAFQELRPDKKGWKFWQIVPALGNYIFQIFYTTITAQILYYVFAMLTGRLRGMDAAGLQAVSDGLNQNPALLGSLMAVVVLGAFGVCYGGLQNSVERISKWMLCVLFVLLIILGLYSLTLPGAGAGLRFYLSPNPESLKDAGLYEVISAAFGQSFFTLGFGAGSLCIFGSYMSRERRLTGQAVKVIALDTSVALVSGLIIFPACFTYGINPANGPNLIMVTMPAVFNEMPGGYFLGALFFIAMFMAAMSTNLAAFENIVACTMDLSGWSRKKAVLLNVLPMILLSLPAVLGMSVWSDFTLLGRDIMGIEDFLVSNNLLPIGAMGYLLFCVTRYGWGWSGFLEEANTGFGCRFPGWIRKYCTYFLPLLLLAFWITGYIR